jgi:hypothetical protein
VIKSLLRSLFFSFILLALVAKVALAETAQPYIENIEVKLSGGDSTGSILVPEQFAGKTTIYTDSDPNESYLKKRGIGTTEEYYRIGIYDKNVDLLTTVYFSQAALESTGGWSDIKKLTVKKTVSGTLSGSQTVSDVDIDTFKNNNYSVTFAADSGSKIDLFHQRNQLAISFVLKSDTKETEYTPSSYTFYTVEKRELYTCNLEVRNSETDQVITQADNETPIKVVGSNINMGDNDYVIWIDGVDQYTNGGFFLRTVKTFTRDLGKLAVENHSLSVRTFDIASGQHGTEDICRIEIPIYQKGATPTPFASVTGVLTDPSSVSLELATTIPLCASVPADADCNGISCQAKCLICEKDKKIWTGIGCLPTDVGGLVKSLFTTFTGILGALIFACVFSNGLKIMSSRGNPEAMKKGQEALTSCIVGFVVLALSVLFLKIVGVDILQLHGWS